MTLQVLVGAVEKRRVVTFVYRGHPRVVQPAAVGFRFSTLNRLMRGYQVGGSSSSRRLPDWRVFTIAKMRQLVITDEVFGEDPPGYRRGDRSMSRIYAQL